MRLSQDALDIDAPGKAVHLLYLDLWRLLPCLPYLLKGLRNICCVPLWSGPYVALKLMLIGFAEY